MGSSPRWASAAVQRLLGRFGYSLVRSRWPWRVHPSHQLSMSLDFVVAHLLSRRPEGPPFFFVEIGAFDGVTDDAIHDLVRRHGWSGVLVEPQPRYFAELKKNYGQLPGLQFLQVAVAAERGTKALYRIGDPSAPGLPDWAPQLASFSLGTLMSHRDEIPDIAERLTSEPVGCITFADLLERVGRDHVDLIQLDAEGYDLEILKSIDFDTVRPAIVRFENLHMDRADYEEAVSLLARRGYRIAQEGPLGFDTIAYLMPQGDQADPSPS